MNEENPLVQRYKSEDEYDVRKNKEPASVQGVLCPYKTEKGLR